MKTWLRLAFPTENEDSANSPTKGIQSSVCFCRYVKSHLEGKQKQAAARPVSPSWNVCLRDVVLWKTLCENIYNLV
ncbi:hypothetical protein NDU88_003813 [Pleurodeles waltl]|uniref:Uncharacterized protein n=1 Tax=Pleurodeles waltl TaxID=8319 RepID=A0AAV7PD60_PLEWA|nr:hypothetical protein NDU88_003813 [Pleurodeles waltl]